MKNCRVCGNFELMETVDVKLPSELLRLANLEGSSLSQEAARLLALELYREDMVSLGRAAELCQAPLAAFMDFAAKHGVPRYGTALRTWKKKGRLLTVSKRDCRSRFIAACCSDQAWRFSLPQSAFSTSLHLR
jgi:predicted HTH domain antitoxin